MGYPGFHHAGQPVHQVDRRPGLDEGAVRKIVEHARAEAGDDFRPCGFEYAPDAVTLALERPPEPEMTIAVRAGGIGTR